MALTLKTSDITWQICSFKTKSPDTSCPTSSLKKRRRNTSMRTPRVPYVKKSTANAAGNASLMQRVKVSHCGPLIVPFISKNDIWAKASGYNFTWQDILSARPSERRVRQQSDALPHTPLQKKAAARRGSEVVTHGSPGWSERLRI